MSTPAPPSTPAVGIDIGGSGVRGASLDGAGRLTGRASSPLDGMMTRERLLAEIASVTDAALRMGAACERVPSAVGVAIPAFVDDGGRILHSVNLPHLEGVQLAEALAPVTAGATVRVMPDIAAAALAESQLGAGRGHRRVLCVALGTGANAALVADGQLIESAHGSFGDAGHVMVDPDGPECACGGRGCLEALASGVALRREAQALGLSDGADLSAAACAGDPRAVAVLARTGTMLGRAIAIWSVICFPDVVTIAGGLARAGELLLAPARRELARVAPPYVTGGLRVVPANLGIDATLVGAALAARKRAP